MQRPRAARPFTNRSVGCVTDSSATDTRRIPSAFNRESSSRIDLSPACSFALLTSSLTTSLDTGEVTRQGFGAMSQLQAGMQLDGVAVDQPRLGRIPS